MTTPANQRRPRGKPESSYLAPWEKELNHLWSFSSSILLAIMAPPAKIPSEPTQQNQEEEERTLSSSEHSPDSSSSLPLDVPIGSSSFHRYLFQKYLEPPPPAWITRTLPTIIPESAQWKRSRCYPAFRIAAEVFAAAGSFTWPHRNADELISYTDEIIRWELAQWRAMPRGAGQNSIQPTTLDLPTLRRLPGSQGLDFLAQRLFPRTHRFKSIDSAIPLPRALRAELDGLAQRGVDAARVYGTFKHAGGALLQALAYYRELETDQRSRQERITQDKRSLRFHLSYFKPRLRPETFAGLEAEVKEIITFLDMFRRPPKDALQRYRRSLGIYRRGTKMRTQAFWTNLIGWTVPQLESPSEKEAFETVSRLLYQTWPKIFSEIDPATVKSRYYQTL